MFASSGEITPPCGVPATVAVNTPSANTPAPSHCRINFNTRRSDTRRPTSTINRSWSIEPKKSRMSASNTNCPPRGNATRIASKASVALRLGRNPKPARQEIGLENRFQDQLRRLLHHPITHSGNTQRPHPAIRFGDLHPPHRRRVIHPLAEVSAQLTQHAVHAVLLHRGQRHPINTGRSTISSHPLPRLHQDVNPADPVEQSMETPTLRLLG